MRGRIVEAHEAARFLERHCRGGTALELGIGSGRVAIPLSEQRVRVEGIDNSDSMLKLLASRTNTIKAWKGDIGNFTCADRYDTIYCVYNTFLLLFTREAQVACLRSAASALSQEGTLVMEFDVPSLNGFIDGQKTTTLLVDHENT
ncbi:MAG: class I SAM-dependent methyltransferase, partial [Mesorhizobium sp.]